MDIEIRKYEVERTERGATLTIVDAVASREWLTAALGEFAIGRAFQIPSKAAVVSRLLT